MENDFIDYHSVLENIELALEDPKYSPILLKLEKNFQDTHITISSIDTKEPLNRYYFERVLNLHIDETGKTLLTLLLEDNKITKSTYTFLKSVNLSIFKVVKVKKESFIIVDLLEPKTGKKYKPIKREIPLSYYWKVIEKNDLIQTFLYLTPIQISTSAIIHDKSVRKFIQKKVDIILDSTNYFENRKELLLRRLFRDYIMFHRYKNKTALEIYELEL